MYYYLLSILESLIIAPMRRTLIPFVMVLLLACRAASSLPSSLAPATLTPTLPPTVTPAPTYTPSPNLPRATYDVRFHPDGGLYVGDQVSFEVIAPPETNLRGRSAVVEVQGVEDAVFGPVEFERYGIAGRVQSTMTWAWDTSGLLPGDYAVTFSIEPNGPSWTETVALLPEDALPAVEQRARWARAESNCCLLYYITGSEAERDLAELLQMADREAATVEERLDTNLSEVVGLVILPRILGHGGFANQDLSVSYLDRRYTGGEPATILRHELVHFLDNQLGGELRPTMLVEGLAVYLSGGHYKPEPLLPRAAALLELGWYLPLDELADDFYPSQHEIGYMEAGALVEYMVERWGWEAFNDFYRDIRSGPDQVDAMDKALVRHFGITFSRLEDDFIGALGEQAVSEAIEDDVRLSVNFYDTARRYQQALDPSAYYLTAWLPNGKEMRERGIVADYLRHPSAPLNVILETLLLSADERLRSGDYAEVELLLQAVNAALDIFAP